MLPRPVIESRLAPAIPGLPVPLPRLPPQGLGLFPVTGPKGEKWFGKAVGMIIRHRCARFSDEPAGLRQFPDNGVHAGLTPVQIALPGWSMDQAGLCGLSLTPVQRISRVVELKTNRASPRGRIEGRESMI